MMAFTLTATFKKSVEKLTEPNIKMQKSGAKDAASAEASPRFLS
jgi:hypothetical protein